MDYIPLWDTVSFKYKKWPGPAALLIGNGQQRKKRNHIGLHVYGDMVSSEVSKMESNVTIRNGKERIKEVFLASSPGNLLG